MLILDSAARPQLKKVINRVASELAELGLTNDVLKDLLESRPETPEVLESDRMQPTAGSSRLCRDGDAKEDAHASVSPVDEPVSPRTGREIAWAGSEDEDQHNAAGLDSKRKGKRRAIRRRRATASYELGGAFTTYRAT